MLLIVLFESHRKRRGLVARVTDQVPTEQREIWTSFARAVGADPREERTVRGLSGIDHPVQSVAVDEKGGRVIIVSAEASPRVAALMQVDVQATMPDVRVLVARPVIIDIGVLARRLLAPFQDKPIIDVQAVTASMNRINELPEEEKNAAYLKFFGDAFEPIKRAWKNVSLPTFNQITDVVNQASMLDWRTIGGQMRDSITESTLDISSLYNIDNTVIDRRHGICPVPLYEFSEADWDLLLDTRRVDELRDRLRQLDIYQYFYPSPDQLALGLIDRGVTRELDVVRAVEAAPSLGHPFSEPELVGSLDRVSEVVEGLKQAGHVVEGEMGFEVTRPGESIRGTIKFRPREGIVSKVLGRFNINLSATPKDFLGL